MRRPLRILVPSGWVAEEVEEYRSLTHELVVEHVERATAEHLAQAGGNHLQLTARSDMEDLWVLSWSGSN
jgi:hypothetical protein